MTRRPPRKRPRADEAPLPPLDDDGQAGSDVEGEYDFGVEDASLDDTVSDELGSIFELDETPDGGLDSADEADDADVGDLADEIDTPEETWTGDEGSHDDGVAHGIDEMPALADDDEGEASDDLGHDVIDEGRFDPLADDVDEASADEALADTLEPERASLPAFALPKPAETVVARVLTEGMVLAAAVRGDRVVLVGDGVFAISTAAFTARNGRARTAKRLGEAAEEWISSVVFVDDGALVAASVLGDVLRSDDDGITWAEVAALGGEDEGKTSVELIAESEPSRRLWARAHGGGWFRSDDGGRQWEGPVLPHPVRAAAPIERLEGVLVATSGLASGLMRCADGQRWEALDTKLPAAPTVMACAGDAWAIAFGRGPGFVSLDGGRTVTSWPLLTGATAMTWCTADDGALQLLVAAHDDAADRATIVRVGVDSAGQPRGAWRVIDIDGVFERTLDAPADDGDERVEQLLRLDPAGDRVLLVTPRGVAVVFGE